MNQRVTFPRVCTKCGSAFYPFRASKGLFCSNKCKFQAKEITREFTCAGCGVTVQKKKDRGKFCSNECYQQSKKDRPLTERLLEQIEKTDYCWLWTGGCNNNGYGRIYYGGEFLLVHRMMYQLFTGEDIHNKVVRHFECDNPPCCNPTHLRIGTMQDNTNDMTSKSRHAHGETTYAKLTEAQALAIIADPRRHADIATDFGIARRTVGHIKAGNTWKHLPR